MADSHIFSEKIPDESPEWFKDWVTERNDYLQKLTRYMFGQLLIKENISADFVTKRVRSGVRITLPHGLNRIVRTSLLANGRVRFFQIIGRTDTSVEVKCYLASTNVIVESPTLPKNRFSVGDSSIFQKGDVIRVGEKFATVLGVSGNEVRIDRKVFTPIGSEAILDAENVTFLIM